MTLLSALLKSADPKIRKDQKFPPNPFDIV